MLVTPFERSLEKFKLSKVAGALVVIATILFALVAWLHKEVLGDESQQPWVRARQTAEGLRSLAFRFLGGVHPMTGSDAATLALERAADLVAKSGVAADTITAGDGKPADMPAVPLSAEEYISCRIDDQIGFYERAVGREKKIESRIVATGRLISLAVAVLGALGAILGEWQGIWAPALAAAATMVATQMNQSRHRFLIESYATSADKLRFAKATWSISTKQQADLDSLILSVETIISDENAGWVQQMLIKPVVPDTGSEPKPARA
jgi:hypothetical protein